MQIPKILLILSLVLMVSCASGSQKYADDYYDQGLIFYERMEYDRAVDSFDKVLELEPNSEDTYKVYYNRGNAYLKARQYEKAIYDLSKALELTPAGQKQMRYFILESRGNAHQKSGQIDASIDDYTQAIELLPRQKKIQYLYHNRGWSWISKERYDDAIDDFSQALGRDAEFAPAYFGRAMAWYRQGDRQRAAIDAKDAVKRAPGNKAYEDLLFEIRKEGGTQ
ncbi:MAG: tetratricopeptide repeat protein [Desulfobacterales bacterium]|nr:tetratricopeptide repeat protein [Desulfobacterales bacterium]